MNPPRRSWAGWAVLGLLLFATPGQALAPDGLALEFRVLRDGVEIGHHRVRFAHRDSVFIVETEIRIAVTFLFVTLYRYELDARETWRDGRLIALASTTNDDGDPYEVSAVANGETISVEAGANSWTAPATVVPASLWRRDMARGTLLLGVEQGERLAVAFDEVGRETVAARGGEVEATHVVVSGGLERDLWYDGDGMLVHLRLVGRDGSNIVYLLE